MATHNNELGASLHILHTFTTSGGAPASNGSNLAASPFSTGTYPFSTADVGKVALDPTSSKFYILANFSAGPVLTWTEITNPATTPSLTFNHFNNTNDGNTLSAGNQIAFLDASAGSFSLHLPIASGNGGQIVYFHRTDTDATKSVTVLPFTLSGNTIDGFSTYSINSPSQCIALASDGSNWYSVSLKSDFKSVKLVTTSSYNVTPQDDIVLCNTSSFDQNISLPAAALVPGKLVRIMQLAGISTTANTGFKVLVSLANAPTDTFNGGTITTSTINLNSAQKSIAFLSVPQNSGWLVLDDEGRGDSVYFRAGTVTSLTAGTKLVLCNPATFVGGSFSVNLPPVSDALGRSITFVSVQPFNSAYNALQTVKIHVNPSDSNVSINGVFPGVGQAGANLGGGVSVDTNGSVPYTLNGSGNFVTLTAMPIASNFSTNGFWAVTSRGTGFVENTRIIHEPGSYSAPFSGSTPLPGDDVILCNTSNGNVSLSLQGGNSSYNRRVKVRKTSSDSNTVTLTPQSGTINGQSSYVLSSKDEVVDIEIVDDEGTQNWQINNTYIPPLSLRYSIGTSQTVGGGNTTLNFDTLGYDNSGGAFNTSTHTFTAPSSGRYAVFCQSAATPVGTWSGTQDSYVIQTNVSGTSFSTGLAPIAPTGTSVRLAANTYVEVELVAGDLITIKATPQSVPSILFYSNSNDNYLIISRLNVK